MEKVLYSNTAGINMSVKSLSFTIYASPAHSSIIIKYNSPFAGAAKCIITDMKGVVLKTFTMQVQPVKPAAGKCG